ncbi:uncharacterized protein LOC111291437 [Durio zibethinus]|uniref:Uncharacterized protein LOC111291437 n=1 Tax=Durio zibethinus TaxID=66656 RepID=A0A6P5YFV3_DURZI|nr:uncharacterized protein LOC111291437 [Durio zibethinus]XP_022738936.1 uncharacterized protein LOC111291437 [Durio zibethinus]
MGKHRLGCVLVFSVIASLGLVSFTSCLVAEAKRPKKADLKLDGKLCFLPASHGFGFGVAALICLSIAQIIGNVLVCANYWSRSGKARKAKKPILTAILLAFSWISFGVAIILISTVTSMSRRQPYGEGWLDGECYMVRGGVYISSGFLSLAAVLALLGIAAITITTNQVDQGQKVYAQNA